GHLLEAPGDHGKFPECANHVLEGDSRGEATDGGHHRVVDVETPPDGDGHVGTPPWCDDAEGRTGRARCDIRGVRLTALAHPHRRDHRSGGDTGSGRVVDVDHGGADLV